MAVRKILTFPDPLLHRVSKPVTKFDDRLAAFAEDMVDTMKVADGIGLAAPQVGESVRLIVVQVRGEEEPTGELYRICNPAITAKSGEARIEEGCLSCPGFYVEVDRAEKITLEGQNIDGTPFKIDAEGLLAICFQHEIDHLDGRLLVNYVSSVKRDLYRTELKRRAKEEAEDSDESEDRHRTL